MKVHQGLDGLKALPNGATLSIGNFDGVHLGHRRIIETMKSRQPGVPLAVATFEPHPFTVLRPNLAPPRLTTWARKQQLLEELGVDHLVILPPTKELLDLSAEQFWEILRDQVRPKFLVEGATFTFGRARGGTIDRLREWSVGSDVQLVVIDPVEVVLTNLHVVTVNSSFIRWLVSYGRMRDATICLGRHYRLIGPVIHGFHRGRTIGVPTANLRCDDQLRPGDGVYFARTSHAGKTYPVALNIGPAPTFDAPPQIEAHLIGFAGDLYDQVLELEVVDWLRESQKFSGVEALQEQLQRDLQHVRTASI